MIEQREQAGADLAVRGEAHARTVSAERMRYRRNDSDLAQAAIDAGAIAFVTKSRLNDDLVTAVRSAVQGIVFISKNSIPKE